MVFEHDNALEDYMVTKSETNGYSLKVHRFASATLYNIQF